MLNKLLAAYYLRARQTFPAEHDGFGFSSNDFHDVVSRKVQISTLGMIFPTNEKRQQQSDL